MKLNNFVKYRNIQQWILRYFYVAFQEKYERKEKYNIMKKICVECGSSFETNTVTVTCSEKCKRVRHLRKRKEYHSDKRKCSSGPVDNNYSKGENVLVHRDVRENNEKVKQKEIAKVVQVYPYFVLCEIELRHRKCLERFRFDEVKRV